MAQLIPCTLQGLQLAAKNLQAGKLVAFPTETVYGLGANALDEQAVLSIFKAKGRPLTDPLIVHVSSLQRGLELVELSDQGRKIFELLAGAFWPGPLTLIAKAVPALPRCVTAETGFVGIRVPNFPIAQQLLDLSQLPIAAPSANRFGHVSPTCALHVYSDLGEHANISIIKDPEMNMETPCQVGIESTVAKISAEDNEVIIYRRGGISEEAMARVLSNAGMNEIQIRVINHHASHHSKTNQPAPGQLLTHYAPDIDTFLVCFEKENAHGMLGATAETNPWKTTKLFATAAAPTRVESTVVLDFGQQLSALKAVALAYQDLSPLGRVEEGAAHIFKALRWAENVKGAKEILVAGVENFAHENTAALHDRMYRAASGKIIYWK